MDVNQWFILKSEIVTDPLGRGYSSMSNQEIANDLNTVYRQINKLSMTGAEVFYNTSAAEYAALSDSKKSQWIGFCGIGEIDPFNTVAVAFVEYIFGVGSTTMSNLQNARKENASRATELGLPTIFEQIVADAKNYPE